jgi:hypothetical protein
MLKRLWRWNARGQSERLGFERNAVKELSRPKGDSLHEVQPEGWAKPSNA